jgi:hypothetical protein
VAVLGERGVGAEQVGEEDDKVLGLVPYKEPVGFFPSFFNIFHFAKFCRMHYFEFFIFVLIKKS